MSSGRAVLAVREFAMVVAMGRRREIGVRGRMPWTLPAETAYFRNLTVGGKQGIPASLYDRGDPDYEVEWRASLSSRERGVHHAVVMGRKTWESLPAEHRPLKDRVNVVVSRTMANHTGGVEQLAGAAAAPGLVVAGTLAQALEEARVRVGDQGDVFVIGGAQVYAEALRHPALSEVFLTDVDAEFPEADAHFPSTDSLSLVPTHVSPWVRDPVAALSYRFSRLEVERRH